MRRRGFGGDDWVGRERGVGCGLGRLGIGTGGFGRIEELRSVRKGALDT